MRKRHRYHHLNHDNHHHHHRHHHHQQQLHDPSEQTSSLNQPSAEQQRQPCHQLQRAATSPSPHQPFSTPE
eukprot:365332-Chlamydomonas_euryale.AAC.3